MTENTREVENILILGNGFDLAMGRKTKYEDFLEFFGRKIKYGNRQKKIDILSKDKDIKYIKDKFIFNTYKSRDTPEASELIKKNFEEEEFLIMFFNEFDKYVNNVLDAQNEKKEKNEKKTKEDETTVEESYESKLSGYNRRAEINTILKYKKARDWFEKNIMKQYFSYVGNLGIDYKVEESSTKQDSLKQFLNVESLKYIKSFLEKNDYKEIVHKDEDGLKHFKDILNEFEILLFSNNTIFNDLYNKFKKYNRRKNSLQDNPIWKFIDENKNNLDKNWSNIELVISNLANSICFFRCNIEDFVEYVDLDILKSNKLKNLLNNMTKQEKILTSEIKSSVKEIDEISELENIDIEVLRNKTNPRAYKYILNIILQENQIDIPLQSVIDRVNDKFIEALEDLTNYLELYLTYLDRIDKIDEIDEIENIQKNENTVISELKNRSNSKVINFNYTDTIRKFGIDEKNIHFIHGRLNFERNRFPINQMVFGIEDKEEPDNVNTDLIPYQKFYQRIVKETGNDYQEFFESDNDKIILVFGHSVDPLDKEIFQNCFRLLGDYQEKNEKMIEEKDKVNYRFIFAYHSEDSKQSIVKNLAIILGKQRLVTLTGQKKIQFVKNDDKKKMQAILEEWEESRQLETAE